jgi:GLPGLI family protein
MKAIIKSLTLVLTAISSIAHAQNARFTTSGTIEYQKSSNTHAIIPRMFTKSNEAFYKPAFEQLKAKDPQFRTLKSTMVFGENKTLYTPIAPEGRPPSLGLPIMEQFNTIYTDVAASKAVTQKEVYGEMLLLSDSTRKIDWKITDETRDILGYACRRANAIIMDSIYVVAFYAEKIPVSGGPETFNGLPGMILQVALPHENISWVATKITDAAVQPSTLVPPKKGKPTTSKDFRALLEKLLKGQGDENILQLYYKAYLM